MSSRVRLNRIAAGISDRGPVVLLSIVAFLAIAAMGFVMPRAPGIEEVTVFNAPFTFAQDGVMSFPVYGNAFLHVFGIHPHAHYGVLGLLLAAGATLYAAEGIVILFSASLILIFINLGKWPDYIKIGLILGLASSVILAVLTVPDSAFSVRPELHVGLMFLAGLLALQGARIETVPSWPDGRLFVGTLCVTFSSTLQNFAVANFLAIGVYALLLLFELRGRALRKLLVMVIAGCIVGIPHLIFYIFPNFEMLQVNIGWGQNYSAPLALKWQQYFDIAKNTFQELPHHVGAPILSLPIRASFALSIPLGIVTFALFLINRSTRALAFACLPPFIVIFYTLPKLHYFLTEYVLFLGAFWCAVGYGAHLLLTGRLGSLLFPAAIPIWRPWLLAGGAAVIIALSLPASAYSSRPLPPHEVTVARAAAQAIVSERTAIASRHVAWYMSGAKNWYRVESDLTEPIGICSAALPAFFRQFDAVVDYAAFSAETSNGTTLSSLYADKVLSLKGFYLGQRLRGVDPFYLAAGPVEGVTGFLLRDNQLERFQSRPGGDTVAAMILRKGGEPINAYPGVVVRNVLQLPAGYRGGLDMITFVLAPRSVWKPMEAALPQGAIVRDAIEGTLTPVNLREFVARQKKQDGRVTFIPFQHGKITPLPTASQPPCKPDQRAAIDRMQQLPLQRLSAP